MQFMEYCTESEKQNGCLGTESLSVYQLFTIVILGLTGGCGSLPLPSIMRDYVSLAREKTKIQNFK